MIGILRLLFVLEKMIINENEVLLLKLPSGTEDKFEITLTKNGYKVQFLQILEFIFLNLSTLMSKLKSAEDYSGIIFTSPRAIAGTKLSLNNTKLNEEWSNKKNYVVGETTYILAKNELDLTCEGKSSGNANNLADLIIQETYDKPFLFPCGNLKKETLHERLKEHNIEIESIVVYETKKNDHLYDELRKITKEYSVAPEYILFFSPSGVHFTAELFRKFPIDKIKLIAIGPSTEKALIEENLPVFSVATKPTDVEVLNAIKKSSN